MASSADGTRLVAASLEIDVENNSLLPGVLYTSTDGGVTWTARDTGSGSVPFVRNWTSVASSADGTRLVAAERDGQLFTSTDGGVTWTARDTGSGPVPFLRDWISVASSADGTRLVAATGAFQLYTSTDGGVTWTAREANRDWQSVASSADGTRLVAATNFGQLFTSTNGGLSWIQTEICDFCSLSGVASSSDGIRLVVSVARENVGTNFFGGFLRTSTDGGAIWSPSGRKLQWTAVASSADGVRLVAVDNGTNVANGQLYTSTDGGVTWTPREGNRNWAPIVASSADGMRLVAADLGAGFVGGFLYTSSDGGVTWTPRDVCDECGVSKQSSSGTLLTWSNPSGGALLEASNWNPALSPGASDDLLLELAGNYPVLLNGPSSANSLLVQGGEPVLSGTGKLTLESLGEGTCGPTLSVQNGARLLLTDAEGALSVSARTVLVGATEGAEQSALNLFGATLEAPTSLSIARNGSLVSGDALSGRTISPGLLLTPKVVIGQGPPAPVDSFVLPVMQLSGGAYDWTSLEVGEQSAGLLTLSSEANLTVQTLKVGQTPGQRGDVELRDRQTSLAAKDAGVGDTGPGRVAVSDGATFFTEFLFLGIGESGELLLDGKAPDGTSSSLSAEQGRLGANKQGLATLQLSQGASATFTGELRAGIEGTAFITVSDPDTRLDVLEKCTVGEAGNGNVDILTGAGASLLGQTTLGVQSTGVGDLKVEGAANTAQLPSSLEAASIIVGAAGQGSFDVRNGAKASLTGDLQVATQAEGRGRVLLDGPPLAPTGTLAPPTLDCEGSLSLGEVGTATMDLVNGATAEFQALRVGGGAQPARLTLNTSSGIEVLAASAGDALAGQVFIGGGTGRSVLELKNDSSMLVFPGNLPAAGDVFVQRNGLLRLDTSSSMAVQELFVVGTLIGKVVETGGGRKQAPANTGIQGNVEIAPEGTLVLEFSEGEVGEGLPISGSLIQSGTLEVRFLDGFEPTAGQVLPLLEVDGQTSGAFTGFRFPTRSTDFQGNIVQDENGGLQLTIVNPGTAVPFDTGEGEGEGQAEGEQEGAPEGSVDGEGQTEGEGSAEGEDEPQPIPGCNGCKGGKSLLDPSAATEWLLGIASLLLLLATRPRSSG